VKKRNFSNNKRTYLSVFLVICTLISSLGFPLTVFADNLDNADTGSTNAVVYENIDHRKLTAITDFSIDDFNASDVAWVAFNSDGTFPEINNVATLDNSPYTALEGNSSMLINSVANHYKWSYTEVQNIWRRKDAADFSSARYFFFAITAAGDENTLYDVKFTVRNYDGASFVREAQFCGGGWNAILFSVDEQSSKKLKNVTSIALRVSRANDDTAPLEFALDQMGYSTSAGTPTALNFLSHGYSFLDRHLYGDKILAIEEFNAENPQLIASGLKYNDFSGGRAIQLEFLNNTNCRSVTFMYTTPDSPYYSEEHSVTVPTGGSKVQTCAFPIPDDTITGFKFVFNGKISGDMEIYSVSAVPYFIPDDMPVDITECIVGKGGVDILLSGEFDAESSRQRSSEKLYLYALDMCDDDSSVLSNRIYAVAETTLHQNKFTFEWHDGVSQGGIYKKYLVTAIMDGEERVVSEHVYVTNPSELASVTGDTAAADSKKGMVWDGTSLETGGSGYVNINVDLAKLFTLGSSDYEYIWGGKTYKFSRELINSLDSAIRSFGEDRAKIYLSLTASADGLGDASVGRVLIHPDSESGAKYSAFNTATSEGINALAAVCEFLAGRYAGKESGGIFGVIIGENISNSKKNYNLGAVELTDMAEEYARALRIAYAAFRSHNSSVRVCVSLGSDWNIGYPADSKYVFDSRFTLDVLSEIIKHGGDIEWSLAFDPLPDSASFKAYDGGDSDKRMTVGNIELLIEYMKHEKLYYNGAYRKVMLIEHRRIDDVKEAGALSNAADYVYSYYRMSNQEFSYIYAYIVNRQLSYGDVYKYVDTNLSKEYTDFALEHFGLSDWSTVIPIFDYSGVYERYVVETAYSASMPQGIVGSAVLQDFAVSSGVNWYISDGSGDITIGGSLGDRSNLMNTVFYTRESDRYRGISVRLPYKYDLTQAPYLSFDAQIAVLPEGINEVELCVTVYSGLSYVTSTGTVRTGQWNPVIIDLSSFDGVSGIDGIRIRLKGIDGADIGEPTFILDDISVLSQTLSSSEVKKMLEDMEQKEPIISEALRKYIFYGAVAVFVLAAVLELAYIAVRYKRGREQ